RESIPRHAPHYAGGAMARASGDTPRAVAFYLPQYHPTAEHDAAWGPGFQEWVNVVGAQPLFRGHRQPLLPADLGFYDLRLAEVRQSQADPPPAYGIRRSVSH